jgi:hypothetical protein
MRKKTKRTQERASRRMQRVVGAHRHHILKCWPEYFEAIGQGRKTFEVREDDRNFQEGDSLELREWNPETKEYTMRWIWCRVSYVLRGGNWGVSPRHVVMAIKLPANHEWPIAVCSNGESSDRESGTRRGQDVTD